MGYRDYTGLHRVLKMVMAAFHANPLPTVSFKRPDEFPAIHFGTKWYLKIIGMSLIFAIAAASVANAGHPASEKAKFGGKSRSVGWYTFLRIRDVFFVHPLLVLGYCMVLSRLRHSLP
jgi:hypothetical protein